jgi:hypothetical protein
VDGLLRYAKKKCSKAFQNGGIVVMVLVKLIGGGVRALGRQIFYNTGLPSQDLLEILKGRISEGLRVYKDDYTNELIFRFCGYS